MDVIIPTVMPLMFGTSKLKKKPIFAKSTLNKRRLNRFVNQSTNEISMLIRHCVYLCTTQTYVNWFVLSI